MYTIVLDICSTVLYIVGNNNKKRALMDWLLVMYIRYKSRACDVIVQCNYLTGEGIKVKVTYWIASCEDDSSVYSLREKTKKEAIRKLTEEYGLKRVKRTDTINMVIGRPEYSDVYKVEYYYKDAFDMLQDLLAEAGDSHELYENKAGEIDNTEYAWYNK